MAPNNGNKIGAGVIPSRTSVIAKFVFSSATTISLVAANPTPPPKQPL